MLWVKFFVYIDNNFLIYILIFVKLDVISYCWVVVLLVYQFFIMYMLDKMNIDVDVLLRLLLIFSVDIVKVICDLDQGYFLIECLFVELLICCFVGCIDVIVLLWIKCLIIWIFMNYNRKIL